ncbi:transglutaminaseTgpA domain-containing protein [Embleya sp. AB8]|uniref:transglutaminase family protein n=1 Tax=Embleya sp. AB8 TaxID=3156304 RepID=UPI003C781767
MAWHPVYGVRATVPVVVVAACAPVLLVVVMSAGGRRLAPLWRSLLVSAVALVLTGCVTLYRADAIGGVLPTAAGLRAMARDLVDAPDRILTTVLPVSGSGEGTPLVLVHVCVWIAAYAGAELALRTRTVLLPAVPALAVLGLALPLGAAGPGSAVIPTVGFAVAAGALVVVRGAAPGGARGAVVFGLPLVAAHVLVGAVLAPPVSGVADRAPYDPHDRISPPAPIPVSGANPLDLVSAWLLDPDRPMFTVAESTGSAADAAVLADHDWRLAVLDRFDGVTWHPADRLARTGGRVPDPAASPSRRIELTQDITMQRLAGVWLPAADRPADVDLPSGIAPAVDPRSGALAVTVPTAPGTAYRVRSRVPVHDPEHTQYASAADDPAATVLPSADPAGLPIPAYDRLRTIAEQATAHSGFPYQQALRLAQWLRENHRYDPTATPGHTYRGLEYFLNESRRGTSEQFATAFAVLARSLGLPTRVVVGFRHGTRQPDGTWQVRGGDALAWPEVEFAGVGWVPFQPTPGIPGATGGSSSTPQAPGANAPAGSTAQRQAADQRIAEETRPNTPSVANSRSGRSTSGGSSVGWLLYLALGGGLAVVGVGATWWLRRRRRRRLRRGDPTRQLTAAWGVATTHLVRMGVPATGALTVRETTVLGAERLRELAAMGEAEALERLADRVNAVAYGGHSPSPAEVAAAWGLCDELGRSSRRRAARA